MFGAPDRVNVVPSESGGWEIVASELVAGEQIEYREQSKSQAVATAKQKYPAGVEIVVHGSDGKIDRRTTAEGR